MSNFTFIQADFFDLYSDAVEAEQLTFVLPKAVAIFEVNEPNSVWIYWLICWHQLVVMLILKSMLRKRILSLPRFLPHFVHVHAGLGDSRQAYTHKINRL